MNTLNLRSVVPTLKNALLIAGSPLIIIYFGIKLQAFEPSIGILDAGILQLLLLSIFSFLGLSALAWWLLHKAWVNLGLPKIQTMVSQFKTLSICQQFAFLWASFAVLLLAAVLSLVAIC